jgi:restriction endonuclease S subunit
MNLYSIQTLKDAEHGTNQTNITSTVINKINIKLPQNRALITELEPTFQEIETLKQEAQEAEKQYTALLNELKAEAIKAMPADYMDEEPLTGDVQTVADETEPVADE